MIITSNETTSSVGNCLATTILCTESVSGVRITTMELVYPRYIHSEFMTHRAFSRNAQSSRATPTSILIEEARANPIVPKVFYSNKAGMVGGEPLNPEEQEQAVQLWEVGARFSAHLAERMQATGAHKQHINRLLEPYLPIKVIVTATEWDNFFKLRLAEDAQPEMQELALAMRNAQRLAKVRRNSAKHLPYLSDEDLQAIGDDKTAQMVSTARCARVSYYKHDGTKPTIEEDLALATRLKNSRHMSPFEHTATDENNPETFFANLRCWRSFRYDIEQEMDK